MRLLMHIQNLKTAGCGETGRIWYRWSAVLYYIQSTRNVGDDFKNQSTSLQFGGDGFRRGRTLEGASGWRLTTTSVVQSQHWYCCQQLLKGVPSIFIVAPCILETIYYTPTNALLYCNSLKSSTIKTYDSQNTTDSFFLSCKANARVNLVKTGHGPHSHKLLCCSMYCLFCVVLCTVCV